MMLMTEVSKLLRRGWWLQDWLRARNSRRVIGLSTSAPTDAALEVLLFGGRSMSCTILRESSLISRRSVSLRFQGRWRGRERSKRRSFQSISGGALEGVTAEPVLGGYS